MKDIIDNMTIQVWKHTEKHDLPRHVNDMQKKQNEDTDFRGEI